MSAPPAPSLVKSQLELWASTVRSLGDALYCAKGVYGRESEGQCLVFQAKH